MESRQKTSADRVYEVLEPTVEWEREPAADILLCYLPGFRKEQLKVQVTSSRFLRITGERLLNDNKWIHFHKEIPIPSNYDTNEISAKFEKGVLYVKHPKIIVQDPEPPQEKIQQEKPAQPPKATPKPPELKPLAAEETEDIKAAFMIARPRQRVSEINGAGDSYNKLQNMIEKAKKDMSSNIDAGKVVTATSTRTTKQENVNESVHNAKDKATAESSKLIARENYNQVLRDVATNVKNPRKLMSSILVALQLVLLWLYIMITKAISSLRKSEK